MLWNLVTGLTLLSKYLKDEDDELCHAQNDTFFAPLLSTKMSDEDSQRMIELGWCLDDQDEDEKDRELYGYQWIMYM